MIFQRILKYGGSLCFFSWLKDSCSLELFVENIYCNEFSLRYTGDFSKDGQEGSWDRVRIKLTQPFRKDQQFGLSLLRVTGDLTNVAKEKAIHNFGKVSEEKDVNDKV